MHFTTLLLPLLAAMAHAAPATGKATTTSTTSKAVTTSTTSKATATTSMASTTSITSTAAVISDVNSACAAQPTGVALVPSIDTAAAFTSYSAFRSAAISAAYPNSYLISFAGASKAVTQISDYMTYYILNSYNPQTCADYCTNTYGCSSFNIFFERSPSLNPAAGCPNPPSYTYVKCSLFSQTIATTQYATNAGQWRGPYSGANVTQNFQVVIAGSNAYNKQ